MNEEQFQQAIQAFQNGQVHFNGGAQVWAFRYRKQWFPIHAFMCHATNNPDLRTNAAIKDIVLFKPNIRIGRINFPNDNNLPLEIGIDEQLQEIQYLVQRLEELTTL